MGRFLRPRILVIAAYLAAVTSFVGAVWWYGYGAALGQLEQRARADLALVSDRLSGDLRRFNELAILTADHPLVRPVLGGTVSPDDLRPVLRDIASVTGALGIILVDARGHAVAGTQTTGLSRHAGQSYFTRAMQGARGVAHLYSMPPGQRAFVFAAPIYEGDGPVAGVLLLYADVELVEAAWRSGQQPVFLTDAAGVVFLSNRSDLVFRAREGQLRAGVFPDGIALSPFPRYQVGQVGDMPVWTINDAPFLPKRALHLTAPVPAIDMTAELLADVAPARQLAALQAAVVAAVCLVFGMVLLVATQRRRTLAALNQKLERRVRDRTAELQAVNADLRREVAERTAAEQRLQKAQDELVQAGKLSALGQMSAGISHELNQPLTAIRSFAENAQDFLARGKPEIAAKNLGRISDLARRMGRIMRNLRAFARQEDEPPSDVELIGIIDAVLEMIAPRAAQDQVTISWDRPARPVMVRGGEVRLQQVILNLATNAMDAMEQSDPRELIITLAQAEGRSILSMRDTGPGIAAPEKIFEPFYTTKAIGAAEGMGLGLSLSYGLVQSFGGDIQGRNHPQGGAVFTVTLETAAQEAAE